MNDLKDAIKAVLENTTKHIVPNDRYVYITKPIRHMDNLLAEYNIHFVEPEEEQLEL